MAWTSDNVTEIAVIGLWSNGHQVVNVFHIQREEDDPAESARDLLNNWQDHIVGALLANNYVLQGCRYADHNVSDGVTGFLAPDPAKPITGVGSGAVLPPNVAILVHKRIETTASQRAGRFYMTPLTETNVDEDGRLDGGTIAANQTNLNAFYAGISGSGGNQLVVVHGTGIDSGEKARSIVSALQVDPFVATQRRRLR